MSLMLILGIGIVAFLIIFFVFKWDTKEHLFLHLFASFFILYLLLLIPKAAIDEKDYCDIVIQNQTTYLNTTTYEYIRFCDTNTKTTQDIFYKLILWFIRVFAIYVFVYIIYAYFMKERLFIKRK